MLIKIYQNASEITMSSLDEAGCRPQTKPDIDTDTNTTTMFRRDMATLRDKAICGIILVYGVGFQAA